MHHDTNTFSRCSAIKKKLFLKTIMERKEPANDTLKVADTPVTNKRPSLVFKEGEIQKSTTSSLDRKPTLDSSKAEKTIIGSETDQESSSWGKITATSILVSVSDENDSPIIIPKKAKRRTKRSPNRDDSDSDDEDENGNKIVRPQQDSDAESADSFNPKSDIEFLQTGFKVGFSEDRNKRFRRTMEDAHTINTKFNNIPGAGKCHSFRFLCGF
jgi:hypothetical protein